MIKKILPIIILIYALGFPCQANPYEGHTLKVISLTPATTEILFALGLDEEIVGVSSFCNYPPEAKNKEKIGTFSQADVEKILLIKPDIVFCTGLEQTPMVTKLKQLKLNVCVSDPSNFDELFQSIREIGELTNKKDAAGRLIEKMKTAIQEITSRTKTISYDTRPKVYVEFWHDPLMSAGKGSFIDELIFLAGGINISHELPRAYSFFSTEQVIKYNPDVIFLAYMRGKNPASMLESRFGWRKISAVKNRRVYNDIDPDILLRPGPRLIEGLKEIYKRLYETD